jgi:hypothetical protein
MFLANDAMYGEIDVLQFIYDRNTTIRERVKSEVISQYTVHAKPPPNIVFSNSPVRILYNIRNDFFVIFYGVEPTPQIPWVAYTIRISDGDLIDWSHPSRTYFKDRDLGFEQLLMPSNINTREGEYVEIPLTSGTSGGSTVRGRNSGRKSGAKSSKGKVFT